MRPIFYNFWHAAFSLSCIITLYVAIWTWILGLKVLSRCHSKVGEIGSHVHITTKYFGSSHWKGFLRINPPKNGRNYWKIPVKGFTGIFLEFCYDYKLSFFMAFFSKKPLRVAVCQNLTNTKWSAKPHLRSNKLIFLKLIFKKADIPVVMLSKIALFPHISLH